MSAIIVIEIVIGLVVLAAAIRFAVRDSRERRASSVGQEAEPTDTAATPAHTTEPGTSAPLSEVGSTETS
jgi:flagellar biosynthesis/type III secretory pathway M-ring protein FliF/YscJ